MSRDMRSTAKARPTIRASTKASTETTMVSHAPRKRSGRKAGISSRANIEILPGWVQVASRRPSSPRKRGPSGERRAVAPGPLLAQGRRAEISAGKDRAIVGAREAPIREEPLHLLIGFHSID